MTECASANISEARVGYRPDDPPEGRSSADPTAAADVGRMAASAARAVDFLKSLSHEQRLMILCHLAGGEKSVGELEEALGARQAAVSQQLARLRHEGLVVARREGRTVLYGLGDEKARQLVSLLYELFCRAG